jgi:peptidoglycan/xylan/chitin deacetylase (PgdA/CDA1 family)
MLRNFIFWILKNIKIYKFFNKKDFGITVVCFHRISDKTDYSYPSMTVNVFKGLIKYYNDNYSIILPKDVNCKTSKPKLIITFDDGYKDFLTTALPVLVHYNVPAIMNVVVNSVLTGELFWTQKLSQIINNKVDLNESLIICLNGINKTYYLSKSNAEKTALELFHVLKQIKVKLRNEIIDNLLSDSYRAMPPFILNVDDLKLCLKNNILIGSHSFTHEILNADCSEVDISKEIKGSKLVLEEIIGKSVNVYASPNGILNERIIHSASEAGYKYFLTTEEQIYTPIPNTSIEIVPRVLLYDKSVDENILRSYFFHSQCNFFLKTFKRRINKILNRK